MSHDHHGSKAAGRQGGQGVGIGAVTETLHLIHKHKAGEITGDGMDF